MRAVVTFFERWPVVLSHNAYHPIFDTHELLNDIYVTDTETVNSLKDCFAEGTIISGPKRIGWSVEVIVWGEVDDILSSFFDICDRHVVCDSRDSFLQALAAPSSETDVLRYVIVTGGPVALTTNTPTDVNSDLKIAANATVTQNIAISNAFDLLLDIRNSLEESTFFATIGYGAVRFRRNTWEHTHQTVAIVPSGDIVNQVPYNAHATVSMLLSVCRVNTDDADFVHKEDASVTIDSITNDGFWTCTCRVLIKSERFEVSRFFPPFRLDLLTTAFLEISDPTDWVIRDAEGSVDNLVEKDGWMGSETPALILSACLPGVRDLVRRRNAILAPTLLDQVEQENGAIAIEETPDDSLPRSEPEIQQPDPSALERAPSPASPVLSRQLLHGIEAIVTQLREKYDEEFVDAVHDTLHTLEDGVPYTLVVGTDGQLQTLQGALPPTVIMHLTRSSNVISLPTNNGHTTRMYREGNGNMRIGRIKVDMDSFVNCERISFYRGRCKKGDSRGGSATSVYPQRPQRGAVHRFAKRMEAARMLMKR